MVVGQFAGDVGAGARPAQQRLVADAEFAVVERVLG
jgi:hypothetical protein